MIRVTSGAYADRLISNLGSITARQARYQAQISTGQRVTLPEDDPGAVRRALDLEGNAVGWVSSVVTLTASRRRRPRPTP